MDLHHRCHLWRHGHPGHLFLRAGYDRSVSLAYVASGFRELTYIVGKDLAEEDRLFLEYLAENGWEGEVGEETVVEDVEVRHSEDGDSVEKR